MSVEYAVAGATSASVRRDSALRRVIDVVVAGVLLVVVLPVLLTLMALVRLDTPGPAIFSQVRVGRGGREFRILKLRTMRRDLECAGPLVTGARDPRVTTVGAFLRATKLDELPQLWNVLVGNMTLIGPRPEVPRYVVFYRRAELEVLSVRPGITGAGQLYYTPALAGELDAAADPDVHYVEHQLHEKLAVELEYVRRRSVVADVRIIAATLSLLVLRGSERRGGRRTGEDRQRWARVRDAAPRRDRGSRAAARVAMVALSLAAVAGGVVGGTGEPAPGRAWPPPYRYMTDSGGAEREVAAAGFNLVDLPPEATSVSRVPPRARALVWLGNYDNRTCSWQLPDTRLRQLLPKLARDRRVAGFYLADEPHSAPCPDAPRQLVDRSRLVHRLAPHTFTYAVIEGGNSHPGEYRAFRGAVDVVGIDPYPCTFTGGCDYRKIDDAVARAREAGLTHIWGVVQAFQDHFYRYPSGAELEQILRHWKAAGIEGEQVFSWSYAGHRLPGQPELLTVLQESNRGR